MKTNTSCFHAADKRADVDAACASQSSVMHPINMVAKRLALERTIHFSPHPGASAHGGLRRLLLIGAAEKGFAFELVIMGLRAARQDAVFSKAEGTTDLQLLVFLVSVTRGVLQIPHLSAVELEITFELWVSVCISTLVE